MNTDDLVTDMAQDVLEKRAPDLPAETKRLSCGIVARRLDLTSETQAKRLGRERGIYLTFDCTEGTFASGGGAGVLSRHIARAVVDMAGVMGRRSVVLAAGLGNAGVTADSLGAATTELLDVSPVSEAERKRQKVRLCAVNAGVEGRTGIRSADVVAGVCERLRPSCVIVIDSLATSSPERLGTSFQLTTAGIAPGSGVGRDRPRIDRAFLGVPVVAVGVPLVLSVRTAFAEFMRDYIEETGGPLNAYALRETVEKRKLGGLVVAPKEIGVTVSRAASVIASAINAAFGENA